jgi:ABC-2 type transport system permease protein
MSEIEAIYAIWKREIIRFWRDKLRLLGSFVQPLLFLIVFGAGFSFVKFGQLNYQQFIFPGIVSMSLVGISIASGVSVIWDKEFGVFKEILVAPISRLSIFLGKALGGATTALIQGLIILSLAFLINVNLNVYSFVVSIFIMLITAFAFSSLGLLIASLVDTFEGFGVIQSFIVFPIIFLSGAIYPLSNAPEWLKIVSLFDPLTYSVEAMRAVIINYSYIPIQTSILVILLFSLFTSLTGAYLFGRKK